MLLTEQDRDRTRVEPKYTWNLTEIFPDNAAWRGAKARVQAELARTQAEVDRYAGELQRHGVESVEREVRWLSDLIQAERGDGTAASTATSD